MVSTAKWIEDETLKAQLLSDAAAVIAEEVRLVHKAAEGTPVVGCLAFVCYVFTTHPPRGQSNAQRIELIKEKLLAIEGQRPTWKLLKEVLAPVRLLYHPDKKLGLDTSVGQDIGWKLLWVEITKALNVFKIPGDTPPPCRRKCSV